MAGSSGCHICCVERPDLKQRSCFCKGHTGICHPPLSWESWSWCWQWSGAGEENGGEVGESGESGGNGESGAWCGNGDGGDDGAWLDWRRQLKRTWQVLPLSGHHHNWSPPHPNSWFCPKQVPTTTKDRVPPGRADVYINQLVKQLS